MTTEQNCGIIGQDAKDQDRRLASQFSNLGQGECRELIASKPWRTLRAWLAMRRLGVHKRLCNVEADLPALRGAQEAYLLLEWMEEQIFKGIEARARVEDKAYEPQPAEPAPMGGVDYDPLDSLAGDEER